MPLRGVISAGSSFVVFGTLTAPGCEAWGAVAAGGFACLDGTELTVDPPAPHALQGDLPFLYARHAAPVYASLAAYEAGAKPRWRMDPIVTYHFLDRAPSTRGEVARREDGSVVPVAALSFYTPSAFRGHDLAAAPLPAGARLGWCVAEAGCPRGDAAPLAYHEEFILAEGEPLPGAKTRTWAPSPRPEGVGPEEIWIDAVLDTQVITVWRGDTPRYATLMSAGLGGRFATPKGDRRLTDKLLANDMLNLPDSAERYHVDQVPWVMHFRPRFALHGAFWHDRYGWPKSHGCINLSAADARAIFALAGPTLPDGWRAIYATEADPGSVVRVR